MRSVRVLAGLFLAAIITVVPLSGRGDVFPPDSEPYGATYSEWAGSFWQWLFSIPQRNSPLNDKTGARCDVGQSPPGAGGPVWFLVGDQHGGTVTKSCTIPSGTAILVSPLNFVYCAFADDTPGATRSMGFVRFQVQASAVAQSTGVNVSIDGMLVPAVGRFLRKSPIFPIPATDWFGATASNLPFSCADEGWFVIVKPLPPGTHSIHYTATNPNAPSGGNDVTYTVTVTP